MAQYNYSREFNPPAPLLPIDISRPGSPLGLRLWALVDSGAFMSLLPSGVVQELGLPQVEFSPAAGAFDGRPAEYKVFAVQLATEFAASEIVRVISFDKSYALLGRDLLNRWRVSLDGPQGILEINLCGGEDERDRPAYNSYGYPL